MWKKKTVNKILFISIFFIFVSFSMNAAPFLGGYFLSQNGFENNKFMTVNTLSFFLDQRFNEYCKFYSRYTAGFKFFTDIPADPSYGNPVITANNFSVIPNIDLLYFEFKSVRNIELSYMAEENLKLQITDNKNYDLFFFRIGRIYANQGSGFVFNLIGDGLNLTFSLSNFKFDFFGITNSFNYLPFFDFIDSKSNPFFTNWDIKRYPKLTNYQIEGNIDGFISDLHSANYNFYFADDTHNQDYTQEEKGRLNKLRYASVIAGRVFTGFNLELIQVYFQNFSLNFTANIDLIPDDFVVTYPSIPTAIDNTAGGKYTSFYTGFNANGKIYGGLFYNFEGVYETGFNATFYRVGGKINYDLRAIHSFALESKLSYFFEHVTKPAIHVEFLYAHGDPDVEFKNDTVVNKEGMDFNYRAPSSPQTGYVVQPIFSNLIVLAFSQTIKPLAFLKNDIFSRFSIESVVLLYMRPIIKGSSFLAERPEYVKNGSIIGDKYENPEKAYLGFEFDLFLLWAIFSDLKLQFKSGIFIPNGVINAADLGYTPLWRVGLTLSISF